MSNDTNDNLVLITGGSATGKSASLRNIPNHDGVAYLNCEAGKKLPFPNKFRTFKITDPYQVLECFDAIADGRLAGIHTVIIDSLTFLMDMFESVHVLGSPDTMKGWSNYQQFFKTLMQDKVAKAQVNVIMTAHTLTIYSENEMAMETKVPVKGALKNNGLEAYFSTVVSTKKLPIKKLEDYKSDLLTITDEEKILGFKYVYQTKLTKETTTERIRSPMGMFSTPETFMDNDAWMLLGRTHEYYNA